MLFQLFPLFGDRTSDFRSTSSWWKRVFLLGSKKGDLYDRFVDDII